MNFFNISDLNKETILEILNLDLNKKNLIDKSIGMIFEKYSTRTRVSFKVGIDHLGGNSIDLRFDELNISRDETFEDTFRALNCYLDGLIYRTTAHSRLIEASKFFKKPIINALSEKSHPCQILSDIYTLKENFGKIELELLWVGDMNNVCFSYVEFANLFPGLKFNIYCPAEISSLVDWNMNSNILVTDNLSEVNLSKVDCVMTDVFVSMNDHDSQSKLKLLKPYTVDSEIMSKTKENSVFMHCLPANIGYEVSEDVIRSPKSLVWRQAYNRMVAQKKLLQFIYQ